MGRRKKVNEPTQLQSLDAPMPGPDGPVRMDVPHPGRNRSLRTTPGCAVACGRPCAPCPAPYRAIVFLREMKGLSTREAATVMGISEDNVKARLHRARVALQAELENARDDRPDPSVRSVPLAVAGAVAVSGRRSDARPPPHDRAAHRGVYVLRDSGRTPAEDAGGLSRGRREAAAPRSAVTSGGADHGVAAELSPSGCKTPKASGGTRTVKHQASRRDVKRRASRLEGVWRVIEPASGRRWQS